MSPANLKAKSFSLFLLLPATKCDILSEALKKFTIAPEITVKSRSKKKSPNVVDREFLNVS